VTETKDALGNKAHFEYDAMDRLTKVTLNRVDLQGFVNTFEITLYEYDHRGLVMKEIGATGLETTYAYDETGNQTSMTYPDETHSFAKILFACGEKDERAKTATSFTINY
jgi:YD repeat-containing protein